MVGRKREGRERKRYKEGGDEVYELKKHTGLSIIHYQSTVLDRNKVESRASSTQRKS